MSANSTIEWTDATVNWWWGCTKVSEACRFCYAETMDKMRGPLFDGGRVHWGPNAPRWVKIASATNDARSLNRKAERQGCRLRVFVNSMSDTFEDHEQLHVARAVLFAEIEKLTNLDFQLLTKRPENIAKMAPPHWLENWPAHVWIGTTVEDQQRADERIPFLLQIPAAVRFLSCEPLLGAIKPLLKCQFDNDGDGNCHLHRECPRIHWVIGGGESGDKARPMHPEWARSLRDQCQAAGVPFLFKQWGEWEELTTASGWDSEMREHFKSALILHNDKWVHPDFEEIDLGELWDDDSAIIMHRIGKRHTGRILDGREWNEFPEAVTP